MQRWESLKSWLSEHGIAEESLTSPEEVKRLDLSAKAIDALPEAFGLLTSLVALNLANNRLQRLPETMAGMQYLSNLDLRHNRFEALPDVIGTFALRSLNVSANRLKNVDALKQCSELRVLDLSGNKLEHFGECLHPDNELRTLNLASNFIRSVEGSFASMQHLERLNLSDNLLEAIPADIGSLEALEVFEALDNRIEAIDEAFFTLEVETVDLSSNRLRNLHLHGLDALEEMTLDNNPFETLRLDKSFAPYLRLFSCDSCYLDTFLLPQSNAIESLCYASNAITEVPDAVARYEKLAELDLEDNNITELPDALANLLALQTLYVMGNPLSGAAKRIIDIKHPDICDLMMKRGVVIEEAKEDDLPQMAALLEVLFAIEVDFTFDYDKQLAGMTRMFECEGTDLLVARDKDEVVGMVTMQRLISSAAGDFIGQIEDLVVKEAYRKSGVGSRLINKMRYIAQSREYKRIQLSADIDNDCALNFYTRRGFSRTHLTVFHFKNS